MKMQPGTCESRYRTTFSLEQPSPWGKFDAFMIVYHKFVKNFRKRTQKGR
jgi:hypothetical protein